MTRVKVCGITNLADARAAVALGAQALGFVLAASPRRITPDRAKALVAALPPLVVAVGVLVDPSLEEARELRAYCGFDLLQLHGGESPAMVAALGGRVIKALAVGAAPPDPAAYPGAALLLDAPAPGGGRPFAWPLAQEICRRRPVILAGGLAPHNVNQAITSLRPHAVDVSSGVEAQPGRKDHGKLAQFFAAVRAAA